MTTFNDIVRLENEHALFDIQTAKGIFLWDILRPYLLLQCLGHTSLFSRVNRPPSVIRKVWEYARLSAHAMFALRNLRGRNILMFGTASRQASGNVADRYLEDIRNSLDGLPILRVEFGSLSLIPKRSEVIIFNHLFILATAFLRLWFRCFLPKDRSLCAHLRHIAKLLATELTAASPAIRSLRDHYIAFLAEATVYGLLFDYTGCKVVVFTHNGMLRGFIHAARKRGITLIEMQHGEIASVSLFYSYPSKGVSARQIYAPDFFLLVGRYWARNVALPDAVSVRVVGSTCCSQSPMRTANNCGGLLVIVNSATGEAALALLLEALKRVPRLSTEQIFLKLHPQQQHEAALFRKKVAAYQGVHVIYDENSVYDLLARVSRVVVFGNSTVIYEAYQSGVPVIVQHLGWVNTSLLGIHLPGIVHSESLNTFISFISEAPTALRSQPADCTEFFSAFSPNHLPAMLHVGRA